MSNESLILEVTGSCWVAYWKERRAQPVKGRYQNYFPISHLYFSVVQGATDCRRWSEL